MIQNHITMEVLVKGIPITEYTKEGLIFVEGRKGSSYKVRLNNRTSARILAVPTVDGLSVFDGKPGSYKSQGYILNSYETIQIDGWRISDHEVREFKFSKPNKSYSHKTGQGKHNIGVISVACFHEKYYTNKDPYYSYTWERRPYTTVSEGASHKAVSNDVSFPLVAMSSATIANFQALSVGTGMGGVKYSSTSSGKFDPMNTPFTVLSIYYNDRKQLKKMGVVVHKTIKNIPQGFPNMYCQEV